MCVKRCTHHNHQICKHENGKCIWNLHSYTVAPLIWIKFGVKRFFNKNSLEFNHLVCMNSGTFHIKRSERFLTFAVRFLWTHVLFSCTTCTKRLLFSCKKKEKRSKRRLIPYGKKRQTIWPLYHHIVGFDWLFAADILSLIFWILFTKCFKRQSKPSDRTHSHPTVTKFFQCAHTLQTLTLIKRF